MVTLKLFGYWYSDQEPYYPHPELFIDENFDPEIRDWVIRYLKFSFPVHHYRGFSFCRFNCGGIPPGTSDNSDGEFIFPSGFIHYVEKHHVKPPQEFIDKVIKNIPLIIQIEEDEKNIAKKLLREKEDDQKSMAEYEIDYHWWEAIFKEKKLT